MRLSILSVVCPLLFALSARAEETTETRKPRPPPDYNARVQLHELPATVAPPKLPEVKEDPNRVETRNAPSIFADRPKPPVVPTTPLAPGQDAPPLSLREMINETLRRSDTRSGSTGWGWLADDIATNRARRAEQQARQSTRMQEEEQASTALDARNREDQITFARATEPDRRNERPAPVLSLTESASGESIPSWLADLPDEKEPLSDRSARDLARANPASNPMDRFFDRGPTDSLSGFGATDRDPSRSELERSAPARPVFEGSRLINSEDYWPVDRPASAGSRSGTDLPGASLSASPIWSTPSFAPISLAPAEVSIAPASPLSSSLGVSQTPAPSPALNAMGGERERAAPRTLPW